MSPHPSTRAVQAGTDPDPTTGALLPPIHQSTTYAQREPGDHEGYEYSRQGNPTVAALERRLASLEDAADCVAFGSGMAAIDALFRARLSADDHVVVSEVVYGGTPRLLESFHGPRGVDATFVDAGDPDRVAKAITEDTRLIFLESPGNPTLRLADIEGVAEVADDHGVPLAVDNTFLTPVGQDVFELGADVSVHSTTKYVEGHNATIGGAVTAQNPGLLQELAYLRKSAGTNQSPQEAWLTLQGLKTLPLRLERVTDTAHTLARRLQAHTAVQRVLYPGLEAFPQRGLADRQHEAHGGLLAFEVADEARAVEVASNVSLVQLAENLGATETLITHPASMTHASLPAEQRRRLGITDGLLRLSVGLEHPDDLWADLERVLDAVGGDPGD